MRILVIYACGRTRNSHHNAIFINRFRAITVILADAVTVDAIVIVIIIATATTSL